MLQSLPLTLAAFLILHSYADDNPDDLEKWAVSAPPKRNSGEWAAANRDDHEWFVTLREGRTQVTLHDRDRDRKSPAPVPFEIEAGSAKDWLAGRRFRAEVSNGWIVAFNAGEFGGGIWWFSPDGKERYKIARARVVSFVSTRGAYSPSRDSRT